MSLGRLKRIYEDGHKKVHPLHVCLGLFSCLLTTIGICSVVADSEGLDIGPHSYKAGIVALIAAAFLWFGNGYLICTHYFGNDRVSI
ncbi:hypothetical protein E3Q22_03238 [Wallemia mellicola]|uniref:Uncharacterized protein n=2 Tax=Wallemia mellicola TaxID=1708541 RepID=A0A4T0QVT8_9BASI|nr:hypothetical protein WALSEDRAFT_65794 [Wallemia mellicola CBS 633.66]TIB73104.1 hypothetical protein E3Q23_03129 [Wallemia mellicola]EIM20002.1 hypothetical protein WALSEDRAFT_65794 [Wallemia mellicola CBS 633.66]TIB77120.1 hypothetical protein E3Q22_03238 [Wallemia mellicola]TIB82870.1 hypothetical protein E3Q21_03221 [Wallemia mellicola]TIB85534.1 hypothetical protein E3Q20_03215 [Wallemia mellicola]|eukprot:XP_006959932.1 hypothetical protein WALSEDRAFT_65794 [Wallemia mellicola CBS 633.66]